ncbi:MAG: class I SAM-dependent methyltransferase [Acidimicrobiales bacterium]|nr:class I SAM-dependent methyltransferase [Acidimicrobiales bacterium]
MKALLPKRVVDALRVLRGSPTEQAVFGMTAFQEQTYYAECARQLQDSEGALVDLGCWMGSTCLSLARGLGDSSPDKIHAFDRFIWEEWMDEYSDGLLCEYRQGESFLPEVRRRTKHVQDRVLLVEADLTSFAWENGDIKLLLVDAMKSAELTQAIAHSFFPSLGPGALLIHQDFKHYYTSWIHILQYRLRSYCHFTHDVPGAGTVAFTLTDRIPANEIVLATDLAEVSEEEADNAFEYSLDLVDGDGAVAGAHVMHFVHAREPDKARERLQRYEGAYGGEDQFVLAVRELDSLGGAHRRPPLVNNQAGRNS